MNKDDISVPRELLGRLCNTHRYSPWPDWVELRALLDQPSDGALTNEGAEPVAWADPKAFANFKYGVAAHEWMWAFSDTGLVPLYLRAPAPASVILPPAPELPEEPLFADDDSHMDAYNAAHRMRTACAEAIAAAGIGLRFEP